MTPARIAELAGSDDPTIAELADHAQSTQAALARAHEDVQRLKDRLTEMDDHLEQLTAAKDAAELKCAEAVRILWETTRWTAEILQVDVWSLRVSVGMDPDAVPETPATLDGFEKAVPPGD